jgi:hypothetical protein
MALKIALSLNEQIDRAKDGRSQKWIISKMNESGIPMNDVQFSRKKLADKVEDSFTEIELSVLSTILNTDFTINK